MRCTGFSRYVSRGNEWLRLLCLSWKKRTRLWFFMHSLRTDTELQTHPRARTSETPPSSAVTIGQVTRCQLQWDATTDDLSPPQKNPSHLREVSTKVKKSLKSARGRAGVVSGTLIMTPIMTRTQGERKAIQPHFSPALILHQNVSHLVSRLTWRRRSASERLPGFFSFFFLSLVWTTESI